MKITRNDILTIAKKPYKLVGEGIIDDLDYDSWVNFIENHREYFIWYEETTDGEDALRNIDIVPDWAKERVLYSLNKKRVYSTDTLMKNPTDLVISYSESDKRVSVSIEKNLNEKTAKILLSMAKHLNALLLKNGTEIIDEKAIESLT
jgi:hypothetical protein